MKLKFLAAKTALLVALAASGFPMPAHAGIPVIDGTNLAQNIMTAIESVAQTLKQIEQYKTQLEQYEDQLRNTVGPAVSIWQDAEAAMNGLLHAVNTLDYYKRQLGSLDAYISKFQDLNYYKSSPCFTSSGCSPAQWAALKDLDKFASEAQKKANDALFKGLDRQQQDLKADASNLTRIQGLANGAKGRMEAIQYANQLASNSAGQLLQIRGLLLAQQNAVATKMQIDANREAQQSAASAQLRTGTYRASPVRTW